MEQVQAVADLATILDRHRRSIASRWATRLNALAGSGFRTRPPETFADWIARGIEALIESVRADSPKLLTAYVDELSRARDRLALGIDDVVQGLLLLKEAALDDLLEEYREDRRAAASAIVRIDECLRVALARYADQELAVSQRLQRVTASFLDMHSLEEVLGLICHEAKELTNAEHVVIDLLTDQADLRRTSHAGAAAAHPDDAERREAATRDGASVALPLRVTDHDVGRLLLTGLADEPTEDHLRFLREFASHAAIAIEHALYHEQKEQLAALEERQKLAHDLHDSVTQSLYGVTMYGEAAARLLDGGESKKASELLRQLRDTSLEALREARLLVYELRSPLLEKHGLAATLQARLAAVEGRTGLETRFRAEVDAELPRALEEDLLGICTEALNNSLKHSKASRISVRLSQQDALLVMEVSDDGQGFDPEAAPSRGGLGLVGMRERAARLGARLSVVSLAGEGTSVRVEAPLQPQAPDRHAKQGEAP